MIEPLILAQTHKKLSEAQFQGLVFLSLLIGGRAWCSLPKMFALHADKTGSIQFLETFLEKHYYSSAVCWILKYYAKLDLQSWHFVQYLEEHPVNQHHHDILVLQRYVQLGNEDFKDFVCIS